MRRITQAGMTLATTGYVIGETYELLRRHLGSRPALAFLDAIRVSAVTRRVPIPAEWEVAVEELLAQYVDQDFSYVDATSFVAMRRLRLTTAFAFDHHFVIAGFALFGERA